jgi:hypothetical protein
MNKVKVFGIVVAFLLGVIAVEFALIYIWNVNAEILNSLPYASIICETKAHRALL